MIQAAANASPRFTLSTTRKALGGRLNVLKTAVANRSPKPILKGIHIYSVDGAFVMAHATDCDKSVALRLPTSADVGPVDCIAEHGLLSAIVRAWPTKGESNIVFDRWRFESRGINYPIEHKPEEFPARPDAQDVNLSVWVDATDLAEKLSSAVDYTDSDNSRYALGGVLIELANGCLSFVGTDGRRLFLGTIPITSGPKLPVEISAIVPESAVDCIAKACKEFGGSVSLGFKLPGRPENWDDMGSAEQAKWNDRNTSADSVSVWSDEFEIVARCQEGRYPRWRDVVDGACKYLDVAQVELGPETQSAIRDVAKVVTKEARATKFILRPDGTIELFYRSPENGSRFYRRIEGNKRFAWDGHRRIVELDATFIRDAIKTLGSAAELHVVDATHPVVLCSMAGTVIVMPMAR